MIFHSHIRSQKFFFMGCHTIILVNSRLASLTIFPGICSDVYRAASRILNLFLLVSDASISKLGMKHRAFLVRKYLMGDFSTKWAHKADKKGTTSDLILRNWVLLIFPLFFGFDSSILLGIEGLTSVAL